MDIRDKTRLVVLPAILSGASTLAFLTADERYVAAPGVAYVVIVLWLWKRGCELPLRCQVIEGS